jgi:hypothetical protein
LVEETETCCHDLTTSVRVGIASCKETQIETLYYTTKHVLRGLHLDEEKQALKDKETS